MLNPSECRHEPTLFIVIALGSSGLTLLPSVLWWRRRELHPENRAIQLDKHWAASHDEPAIIAT